MTTTKIAIHSAIVTALALGVGGAGTAGAAEHAEAKDDMVKCYGIVKAGKNDCQTATSSCAGTSNVDAAGSAFVLVPKGTCQKIVGASLKPQTEDDITRVETGD